MNKNRLFMIITPVLCVLLFLQRLTGGILHAVFGLLLAVMMVVHVCRHMGKFRNKKLSVRVVDVVLMAALAVLVLTGILAHPLHGVLAVKILHKLSAVIFVLAGIGHAVQYKDVKKL